MSLHFQNVKQICFDDPKLSGYDSTTQLCLYIQTDWIKDKLPSSLSDELSICVWKGNIAPLAIIELSSNTQKYCDKITNGGEITYNFGTVYSNKNSDFILKAFPKQYCYTSCWLCNDTLVSTFTNDFEMKVINSLMLVDVEFAPSYSFVSVASLTNGQLSSNQKQFPAKCNFDENVIVSAIPTIGYAFYRWNISSDNNNIFTKYSNDYSTLILNLSAENTISSNTILSASFISAPDFTDCNIFEFTNIKDIDITADLIADKQRVVVDYGTTN